MAEEPAVGRKVRRRIRRLMTLGRPSDRTVMRAVRWLTAFAIAIANLAGTAIVFVILVWVIPPDGEDDGSVVLNLVFAAAYVLLFIPFGIAWAFRRLRPSRRWLREDRDPTPEEQRNLLRAPLTVFFIVGTCWLLAAVGFGIFNTTYSFELGRRVAIAIVLAGLATCQIAYLLTEWLLRPAAARALAARPLDDPALPGVTARTLFTWGLGSGVPMIGLAFIGLSALVDDDLTRDQLAVAVLALMGTGLLVGLLTTFIAARVTADPIISVRHAVSDVTDGDLNVEVPVYDGSELGLLQSGFNQMVTGLRERERIRELFGRHVGEDVAREALEREEGLGGEIRSVAILFIDMTGSTELASSRPATEVVDLLNEFFGVVVETVDSNGGWVNKFEGDAALAVFGAPQEIDDPAGRALRAAREMSERLGSEVEEVEAGIGVSFGETVAGNVGGAKRFEYTVIGDAVNEAARLCDLAKERGIPILASASAVEEAGEEASSWEPGEEVELRGRAEPTRLACPRA
jgi:adenylate cyclase